MKDLPINNQEFLNKNKKTALIIEDNGLLIEKTIQKLKNEGFDVWAVYSLKEALHHLYFGLDGSNEIVVFLIKKQ